MFDIIVIVLPIPALLKLDVSTGRKVGYVPYSFALRGRLLTGDRICSCFLVGFVATACSIVRLTQLNGLYTARNITWDFTSAGLWSLVSELPVSSRPHLLTCSPDRSLLQHDLLLYALHGWSDTTLLAPWSMDNVLRRQSKTSVL